MRYRNYSTGPQWGWMLLMIFLFMGGFRFLFAIFGLALALLINFFPLVLMGFIAYQLYKTISKKSNIHAHIKDKSFENKRYSELLVHLIVHVIRADNRVDPRELQAVASFFQSRLGFSFGEMMWVQDLLQHAINQPPHLQSVCIEMNRLFKYDSKRLAIELLYQIAAADGQIDSEELFVIEQIVRQFNISQVDHERIRALYGKVKTDKASYHKILGVKETASKAEIKKAYREACKENHPDKVAHLGSSYQKAAKEKMQKINEAYEKLSKLAA